MYKRTPVNIITGFLGAGKTTAIIHLLKQKRKEEKWAVIINEFGKVSIDFMTLSPLIGTNENIYEISGGCICCSAQSYFQEDLEKITKEATYDRILIEPSGLGGIEMVTEIIKNQEELQLQAVICMVAATALTDQRMKINPIFRSQLSNSDIILLNKCDLVSEKEHTNLLAKIRGKYPDKNYYGKIFQGEIDPEILQLESTEKEDTPIFYNPSFTKNELSATNYYQQSISFAQNCIFSIDELVTEIRKQTSIIRAKAYIRLEQGWYLFNYSMGEFDLVPCSEKSENTLLIIMESGIEKESISTRKEIERCIKELL